MPSPSTDAREAVLDRLPPDEQARVLRLAERVGPAPADADWLVAAAALQAAETIADAATRVANAADRANDTTNAIAELDARISEMLARHEPRAPLLVAPTGAAAIYVAAALLFAVVIATFAYFTTRAIDDARFRAAAPRLGALIATPSGRDAVALLEANGDALHDELRACRRFDDRGRAAVTCTFWSGGATPLSTATPASLFFDFAARAPAWPLVLLGVVVALAFAFRPRKKARWT